MRQRWHGCCSSSSAYSQQLSSDHQNGGCHMALANNVKVGVLARHTLTHLFIIALGLFMIYPIVWMIVSSFKPNNMIFSDPGLIPKAITFENYVTGWRGYAGTTFGTCCTKCVILCVIAIVGNLSSCS